MNIIKQNIIFKTLGKKFSHLSSGQFPKVYAFFSLFILLVSTLYWSLLGAHLQSSNADQLVNPRLFENSTTFHQALWPGAHTFLIKWPLFLWIKILGLSDGSLLVFTVAIVLITIIALAAILYRIERRPMVFGTLCLALASALMLVPTVPYAGALLPVNMAMLTTRNIEYVLYLGSLLLLVEAYSLKRRRFWLAVGLLALLIAGDKLLFDLSLGGALIALMVYALSKGWNLVSLSVNWLVGVLLAGLMAIVLLWGISTLKITSVISASSAGPYALVHNLRDLQVGVKYAFLEVLTNFGANPAFDATAASSKKHLALTHLSGVAGFSLVINLLVFLAVSVATWRLLRHSLAHNRDHTVKLDQPARLSILLMWVVLATILIFIFSNHYYLVDARYLTIAFFAGFIALATDGRRRQWSTKSLAALGGLFLISTSLGSAQALNNYHQDKAALAPTDKRNSLVVAALKQHPVKVLVGDYWRVIPAKQLAPKPQFNVLPLSSCFTPRDTLSSGAWNFNLNKNSFAYLLSLDQSLTDFPHCNLDQVINEYGRPNSSLLISGSLNQPKELLLFYDHGAHKSAPITQLKTPSTVLPISLDELPHTFCPVPTTMNIVAHEDDDLLFMNPDLLHDIKAGHCVRTIYVTAGDAGAGQFYWLSRQLGSEAAYASAIGTDDIWIERIVKLSDQQFIIVANPRGNDKISLIFMHLPDGGVKGQGFAASHFSSLAKLDSGAIHEMQTVDDQSTYSSSQLNDSITALMHAYQPAEIRTQANLVNQRYADHSDHMAVGRFVKRAYNNYETQQYENRLAIPLDFYIGYPIHGLAPNISDDDLTQKEKMFMTYSKFDGGACQTLQRCLNDPAYGAYLTRQYQNGY